MATIPTSIRACRLDRSEARAWKPSVPYTEKKPSRASTGTYVAKEDGHHVFTKTYDEHRAETETIYGLPPDTASIKKKLETIAERDNVPIMRCERDLLLEAAEPKLCPGASWEIGQRSDTCALGRAISSSEIDTIEVDPEKDMKLPFPP